MSLFGADELTRIVTRSARLLDIAIDPEGAVEIARRSRGTPRIANRLLRRVRDFAEVRAAGHVTRAVLRTNPSCTRNGSYTSSRVVTSSPITTASDCSPTGPPS